MATAEQLANRRIKCRAYKNEANPDGRESLCGEPVQIDPENGREFFEIPGHQREYQMKLNPSYEFTESYDISDRPAPIEKKKGGRPRNPTADSE